MTAPHKSERPACGPGVAGSQSTEDRAIVAQQAEPCLDKRIATLTALLALRGFSLHRLAGGTFLVARWDRTMHLADLGAVQAYVRQIGGRA